MHDADAGLRGDLERILEKEIVVIVDRARERVFEREHGGVHIPRFQGREHVIESLVGDGLGLQPQKLADGLLAEGAELALKSDFRRLLGHLSPLPMASADGGSSREGQHAIDAVVDQVGNGLGVVVEGGRRRREDRSHFGQGGHGAQVAKV